MLYVPSMRNGASAFEDRGNAIVSTERLHAPFAVELPLERQRRVAVGAAIDVRTIDGPDRLDVVTAHLEPLSSRASLWIFSSPRPRQVVGLLNVLRTSRPSQAVRSSGTVLGGDFNTIQAGAGEDAYSIARAWSRSLLSEDPRRTHLMGRLDYLFFRLQDGWTASTTRVGDKYGSDHHPVIGRLAPRQSVAMTTRLTEPVTRSLGLAATIVYAAVIAWLLASQPRTVAEAVGGLSATVGTYDIDAQAFADGLAFFRRDQFVESRAAFSRADPASRDARTQFYIAYSCYRQGWHRTHRDDVLYRGGLKHVDRAIAWRQTAGWSSMTTTCRCESADELRAELEAGVTRDASDLNPLRLLQERK